MRYLVLFLIFISVKGCVHNKPTPAIPPPIREADSKILSYKKWLQKSSAIKNNEEKILAINYIEFLDTKSKKSADKVIFSLKRSSQKAQQPLNYKQFGLFKNSADLIYKTESLPTISIKNLIPLIEQGNESAIELFLIYSAATQVNSSEAPFFSPIGKVLNEKYSEKVLFLTQKHSAFFQKFPPLMVQ